MVDKLEDEEKQEIVKQSQRRQKKKEEKEAAKVLKKTDRKPVTTPRNQLTRPVISKRTRNLVRTPPRVSGTRKTNFTLTSPRTNPNLIAKIEEDIFPQHLYEKTKQNLKCAHFSTARLATGKTELPIGDEEPEMCDQPGTRTRETRQLE